MDCNKVLVMLKKAIKDDSLVTKANKDLRIERWLMANFVALGNLNDEKWDFVVKVFADPLCWNSAKLEREIVGLRLIQENNNRDKKNPLNIYDRYYFACKFCLINEIPYLFCELFEQFKMEMAFGQKDDDYYIREELLRELKRSSPIEYFWSNCLDKLSGGLVEYPTFEKFKEVMRICGKTNWGEAIEFFYNRLQNDKNVQDCLIDIVLTASKNYTNTDIIEFCVLKMTSDQKEILLQRDYKENNGLVLLAIIDQYHLQLFCDLLEHLNVDSFSSEHYGKLICSLARKLILNKSLASKTKEALMCFWRHKKLKQFKNDIFKDYELEYAIAPMIVDMRSDPSNEKKQSEILEILQHPDKEGVKATKKPLLQAMRRLYRVSEEQYNKDVELIEELFSKIGKTAEEQEQKDGGIVSNVANSQQSVLKV